MEEDKLYYTQKSLPTAATNRTQLLVTVGFKCNFNFISARWA